MGIIWFCAGILGVFLSSRKGQQQRNLIPAVVIVLTGWSMASHAQELEFSTNMHALFGHTLMAAGVTRIVEIVIVLRDAWNAGDGEIRSFQYLPPFVSSSPFKLIIAAHCFRLIIHGFERRADPSSHFRSCGPRFLCPCVIQPRLCHLLLYILTLTRLILVILYLIWLYTASGRNADPDRSKYANGHDITNGSRRVASMEQRRLRDVEEFELGGLLDEDEDADKRDSNDEHTPLAKRSSIEHE
jgi:hypothetical protein